MLIHSVRLLISTVFILFLFCSPPGAAAEQTEGPYSIHFQNGKTDLDPDGAWLVDILAEKLRKAEVRSVVIEGFGDASPDNRNTDPGGKEDLRQARARKILQLLTEKSGLRDDLFQVSGNENPLASNDTEAGEAMNRGVQIWITLAAEEPAAAVQRMEQPAEMQPQKLITVSFRDATVAEAFEMLSIKERINVILDKDVQGSVSLNLYDVTLEEALQAIAEAAGCVVEKRTNSFVVSPRQEIAADPSAANIIRTFKLQYAQPGLVKDILAKHVTGNGSVTVLEEKNILVVEDTPESIARLAPVLEELDKRPRQILIEAKILEITLDQSEKFGLDWAKLFSSDSPQGTQGSVGVSGLLNASRGFLVDLTNMNVTVALDALSEKGRVKTLSTPKLIALENQEASVIVGDRQGYTVTTTINQVTSESVLFLESGVILKVTPTIDNRGRILMRIHPEVSTGTISDGIPSQTTTEVTTDLLADDGQTIFIGGLIKNHTNVKRAGVPLVSDIPLVGNLFGNREETITNTETVVLITPHIIDDATNTIPLQEMEISKLEKTEKEMKDQKVWTDRILEH